MAKSKKEPRFIKLGKVTHKATVIIKDNPLTYVSTEVGDDVAAIRVAADDTVDKDFALVFRDKEEA